MIMMIRHEFECILFCQKLRHLICEFFKTVVIKLTSDMSDEALK